MAPTAKGAKLLRDETGMSADTVAKLLYEWRTGQPHDGYRLPPGATVVVDEAGMCGTGALDQLVRLTVSQHWRLVLVGDPRQLQAVGRGAMFDELCRTGRAHELATTHRFRHPWEQQASLLLRAGNPEALDAYFAHRRINAGTFDDLAADAARQWINHTGRGQSVALVAETNEHVDALNGAVQAQRRLRGHLGERTVGVAGDETASVGEVLERVLTNDRADVPAVVQRRNLAPQVPRARAAEDAVTVARRALGQVQRNAKPYLQPLGAARSEARAAEAALREQHAALADAPRW